MWERLQPDVCMQFIDEQMQCYTCTVLWKIISYGIRAIEIVQMLRNPAIFLHKNIHNWNSSRENCTCEIYMDFPANQKKQYLPVPSYLCIYPEREQNTSKRRAGESCVSWPTPREASPKKGMFHAITDSLCLRVYFLIELFFYVNCTYWMLRLTLWPGSSSWLEFKWFYEPLRLRSIAFSLLLLVLASKLLSTSVRYSLRRVWNSKLFYSHFVFCNIAGRTQTASAFLINTNM